jgi:hypothetical protein
MCRWQQIGDEDIGNRECRLFVGTHTNGLWFSSNAVCAAEQTAKRESSRLSSSLEARCTVRRLCFAEVARRRDRAGTARRVNRPAMESTHSRKVHLMLYTIAVVLLVLWLLGLVTSYTMGGFVHVLLVVAVIMILVNLISGRRAL